MTLKPPNYTQIPNAILDLMPDMEESELRIVLVIARQTFGWHRESDQISVKQLMAKTGMARQTVLNGVQAAIARNVVERTPAGQQTYFYRLLISRPESEPVSPLDRYNGETGLTTRPEPVYSVEQQPVYSVDPQKKGLKKLKETPPPPLRARRDVAFGGGGGDERMETDDEGNSPEDSQWEEAETANVKADLVDALAALGVRPEMAKRAVDAKTVTSDRDVILCKRFIQSSTAHTPAAVLWLQYLSVGRLPPAPYSDTSTVSEAQIAAARRLAAESDARSPEPDQYVGSRAMAAVLAGSPLKHIARAPIAFPGRTAP